MAQLLDAFRELSPPASGTEALPVRRIIDSGRVWVGQDPAGRPVVVIESIADGSSPHGVVLNNFTFEPWIACRIHEEGTTPRDIQASVIRCTAPERELHEHFLRALSPSCEEISRIPKVAMVSRMVEKLVQVFEALAQPSRQSVQGLWAELLLISNAYDIEFAAQAWQTRARSLVDFQAGNISVEVKSSTTGVRQHRFRLTQLQTKTGSQCFVASLLLEAQGHGASISDLWDVIEERLGNRNLLRDRVAARIAQTLGDDWQRGHAYRFGKEAAFESLLIFDVRAIPRVGEDAAPGITDIEFTVDLAGSDPTPLNQIANSGRLLESLFGSIRERNCDNDSRLDRPDSLGEAR